MTAHEGPERPEPFDDRALAERARELTRRDRRADRRLFWLELGVVLVIVALLVARWWWLL
ncbi:hypothetical protein ABZ930_22375 [Streptomyces sp. NPDC046716]|uniref:hypothetical protein n=1 Tax=Streptomyces sp. NPDC046716 TaxID=3157093 RepID=UPI0033FC128E